MKHLILLSLLAAPALLSACWSGALPDADPAPDQDGDVDLCGDIDCDQPAVRYVDVNAPAPGNGRSWATAVGRVQQGIDAASCAFEQCGEPFQVWVAAGTYYIHRSKKTDTVLLRAGVETYGGFVGNETALKQRDFAAHPTVLDGRNGPSGIEHVLHVVTGSDDAVLDGFTVTGGNADGDEWPDYYGGGMYNYACSPTIANCRFVGNRGNHGGGMYNEDDAAPLVSDCLFEHNQTPGNGGGLRSSEASPTLVGCTFENNSAGKHGAGVACNGGAIAITGCTFTGNSATGSGGGVYIREVAAATVDSSLFSGNDAPAGGGLCIYKADAVVTACELSDNSADSSGGGAYIAHSAAELRACRFTGNYALDGGGGVVGYQDETRYTGCVFDGNEGEFGAAMFAYFSDAGATSCLFTDNQAWVGGGVYVTGHSPWFANCTFHGNSADEGSALYVYQADEPWVTNSILWNNEYEQIWVPDESTLEVSYSDVQWGFAGLGNFHVNPLFVDAAGGDFRLQDGSPCIDAADGNLAPDVDFDGNPRYDDPDTPNTGIGPPWADIGAHEFQP